MSLNKEKRVPSSHLSEEQLLVCLFDESGSAAGSRSHLDECDDCHERYLHMAGRLRFSAPDRTRDLAQAMKCPEDSVWLEFAAGGLANQRGQLLEHASNCVHCSQALRDAIHDLGTESEQLSGLESSTPRWRTQLARSIAAGSDARHTRPREINWLWPVIASTTVAAVVVIGFFVWGKERTNNVSVAERMLMAAAGEHRIFEYRIEGAQYAQVKVERGGTENITEKSPSLLKAELLISENYGRSGSQQEWLRLRGRAHLLEGDFSRAIDDFSVLNLGGGDQDSLNLAIATAAQADVQSDSQLLLKSLDRVSAYIKEHPADPVALHNRALVAERLHLYPLAEKDWTKLLQVERDPRWREEAESHLTRVKQLLSRYPPVDLETGPNSTVFQPDGSYSAELALANPRDASLDVVEAALNNHHDSWLRDTVQRSRDPSFQALLQAISANEDSRYDAAIRYAVEASRSPFPPIQLRARLEQVYALHLSQQAAKCLSSAHELLPQLPSDYAWMQTQLMLETAICANMSNDMSSAETYAEKAERSAEEHGFNILRLRAASLTATLRWAEGDNRAAIDDCVAGLKTFWSASYPPIRGYNLFATLDSVADDLDLSHAHTITSEHLVAFAAADKSMQAMAQMRLGDARARTGDVPGAQSAFSLSRRLLSELHDPAADSIASAASISIARAYLSAGEEGSARQALEETKSYLDVLDNRIVRLDYLLAQGELLLAQHDYNRAATALKQAIELNRKGESTIASAKAQEDWSKKHEKAKLLLLRALIETSPETALDQVEALAGTGGITHPEAGRGTAMVAFRPVGDGLAIWTTDDGRRRFSKVADPNGDLRFAINLFKHDVKDRSVPIDSIRRAGGQLARSLFGDLETFFDQSQEIQIDPGPVLADFPFEALADDTGSFWGLKKKIVYGTSLRAHEVQLDRRSKLRVISGQGGRTTQFLPDLTDEVSAIKSSFPLTSVSSKNLTDEDWSRTDVVHLAGHGMDAAGGTRYVSVSGAYTSDSTWKAASVISLHPPKLVVLAFCNSVGPESSAQSTGSIVRALGRAGVPTVVAARWSIDSNATNVIMRAFYKALSSGSNPVEALSIARQHAVARGFDHPADWAGFSIFD